MALLLLSTVAAAVVVGLAVGLVCVVLALAREIDRLASRDYVERDTQRRILHGDRRR